jgi:hypothetical protein
VKGRAAGADSVTITHNELQVAVNSPNNHILAVVEVEDNKRKITCFSKWAERSPAFAEESVTINLKKLRQSAIIAYELFIEG